MPSGPGGSPVLHEPGGPHDQRHGDGPNNGGTANSASSPGTHVDPDVPSGDNGNGASPHSGRSVLTSADDSGPHWHRVDDGSPDPNYGQRVHDGGDSGPYPTPAADTQGTWDLVRHPEEPYGHDANGDALTKAQYDERYTQVRPDGDVWDLYPPNRGAVPGTRAAYGSAQAFIEDFGNRIDRVGGIEGKYFGVLENGMPASFEERSLPVASLGEPYLQYRLSGMLPEGWTIEVSEVAPAFGRDGGGLQMVILNNKGEAVPVHLLLRTGVIE